MKIQLKIALMFAFVALLSSCQKENIPMPGNCPTQDQSTANQRFTIESNDGNHNPVGNAFEGGQPVPDSSGIVGGGDDDRDGGIVGGGDDDKDGGSKKGDGKKP